jgi:hypothetical protein
MNDDLRQALDSAESAIYKDIEGVSFGEVLGWIRQEIDERTWLAVIRVVTMVVIQKEMKKKIAEVSG